MTRAEKIRLIRAGGKPEKQEMPLFWDRDNHGNYIAGPHRLTPEQFEKLNRKQQELYGVIGVGFTEQLKSDIVAELKAMRQI